MLVDSNVLLDIITGDPSWSAWSARTLARHLQSDALVINPIVYAELAFGFERIEDLSEILPATDYEYAGIPREAAFLAARVHADYRTKGGTRTMILPDFLIGAHAIVERMALMTRDVKRYQTYFPSLVLIAP